MSVVHREQYGEYSIEVWRDSLAESPRAWDNLGTMACFHRRYSIGDTSSRIPSVSECREIEDSGFYNGEPVVVLPIYAYEHGQMTISTSPFHCPWDSGKLGIIFVTHTRLKSEFSCDVVDDAIIEKAKSCLRAEVDQQDRYIRGDVYGYTVTRDGVITDDCGGFYSDVDDVLTEIKKTLSDPIVDLMKATEQATASLPNPENGQAVRG